MKKTLTSVILIAILLVVSLQVQAEARFDDRTGAEPYRASGYWSDQNYSTYGIDGETYIYSQNPITYFWQEFVAEMKTEVVYVPPYSFEIRATYYITASYYQYGSSYRQHYVRYRKGWGGGSYMIRQPDILQPGTHHDYTIMNLGISSWYVIIDGGVREIVTFPSELAKCNIWGLTSKNHFYGSAWSWYDKLQQLQRSPWGWHYWDGGLVTDSTLRMGVWEFGGHCFFTYAE